MVTERLICDHCHDTARPMTEENAVSVMNLHQFDSQGNMVCNARVHRECAEAWAKANGGSIAMDACA